MKWPKQQCVDGERHEPQPLRVQGLPTTMGGDAIVQVWDPKGGRTSAILCVCNRCGVLYLELDL